MRILHIAECAGGVERYLSMLLPLLEQRNMKQYFLCSQNYDRRKYTKIVDGVKQIDLRQSFSPLYTIRKVFELRKEIKSVRPDIVYCHSSFAGGLGRLAAIGLPCKVVYNPHGWAFNVKTGLKSRIYLIIERLLAPVTDRIVCISKAEEYSAKKKHVDNGKKLQLIPNGINIEAVRLAKAKERKEFGMNDDDYIVGMIGRLTLLKAPDTFIRAAKLIKEKIPKATFVIVGDGEMSNEITRYASENDLHLYITGWTNEPYTYLKTFDVALLLSRWWEGFGLAIVEYMAAEKNVVATRTYAIPTLVDDGIDGLLVKVDSPEDVCEKVVWLYNHSEEAAIMRKAALQKVYEKFDIQRVADQHVMMFETICYTKDKI